MANIAAIARSDCGDVNKENRFVNHHDRSNYPGLYRPRFEAPVRHPDKQH